MARCSSQVPACSDRLATLPLGSAYLGGPARLAADATIGRVAEKHGATPAQIALAWLLARYERMLLIPGTSSLAHLEENMAAIESDLDDTDVAALDRAGGRPERSEGSTVGLNRSGRLPRQSRDQT
jgi:aryl-alcohol dehydrogenase-like predicted oxidoreductase